MTNCCQCGHARESHRDGAGPCNGPVGRACDCRQYRRTTRAIQDGALFFDDETGDELFASSIIVTDYDLNAAVAARAEFLAWANRQGLVLEFA